MSSLIILRGLPGSGKSTLAAVISDGKWPVFSIDDYFTNKDTGEYNFEFEKNHLAYKSCIERTRVAMQHQTDKIILDNTFTFEWELEPYFELCKTFGYSIFVATVENRHKGKNIHGIPDNQVEKMAAKFNVILM